jgi:hypothetical protein
MTFGVADLSGRAGRAEGQGRQRVGRLAEQRRRLDELRVYSNLRDEHFRELPHLVHGRDKVIRDYTYSGEHEELKRRLESRATFLNSSGLARDVR